MSNANQNLHKLVLLVGDLIIDVHHFGARAGSSTEASVPVGRHESTITTWGGAGLVARNLEALGVPVQFLSPWPAVVKERFLVDGEKVLRWNRGERSLSSEKNKLLVSIKKMLPRARLLVVSDYRQGLISKPTAQKILALAQAKGIPVYVDSQVARNKANHRWYAGADLILLNQAEAKAVDAHFDEKKLSESLTRLQKILKAKNIIVKLGARGSASLFKGEFFLTPAKKVKAVDAVGAGDAFLAALASSGTLDKKAVEFANQWAALATTVRGTEPPKRSMIKR